MMTIKPKKPEEIKIMKKAGSILAEVKNELSEMIKVGVTANDLERKALQMIKNHGAEPSFKRVRDYKWATCVNINDGVVHGVPNDVPFQEGDIVSVDAGVYYQGFHADSAFTSPVGRVSAETAGFLAVGRTALKKAMEKARDGNKISDISKTIQRVIEKCGYSPSRDLTGHGIGRALHEEPYIPCFWADYMTGDARLVKGVTLAIEVIYSQGAPDIVISPEDHWTIRTKDGKIAALFEETILVTTRKPLILTSTSLVV